MMLVGRCSAIHRKRYQAGGLHLPYSDAVLVVLGTRTRCGLTMDLTRLWTQYREELASDPLLVLAFSAALLALATTPLAFAVLGRLQWFKARRGRVLQRPEFSSIVVAMLLAMGIPAIFAALVLKSRSFDHNRYEFDPNRTWSVLEQGRGFQNLKEADAAVKEEMQRLAFERKTLVENVKKLDEAMLALRNVANTSQLVAQRLPSVLQSLSGVRKSVGLDGPQQLLDYTAPPVDLRALGTSGQAVSSTGTGIAAATTPAPAITAAVASPAPSVSGGLSPAEIKAELAAVPEPQKAIAAMLPLAELPPEWTVAKSGDRHLETFNADNLYEKIDGRAESFIQYSVKGMAYAFYHPTGDPSNELQVYIFEMADQLKAMGKYGSEKPEEFTPTVIGSEGYTSAGSLLFYSGRYYTQIVSTLDDAKFAAFALELAKRVADRQKPGGAAAPSPGTARIVAPVATNAKTTGPAVGSPSSSNLSDTAPKTAVEATDANSTSVSKPTETSPAALFALLPAQNRQGDAKYVAQDVFGYSFFADVFMADYKTGDATWQGFLRPYRNVEEAKAVLEKYIDGVKKDGAEVKRLSVPGADEMVSSTNIGLTDFVFRKGNTLAGANGATSAAPAETFSRYLAKSLPTAVPSLDSAN